MAPSLDFGPVGAFVFCTENELRVGPFSTRKKVFCHSEPGASPVRNLLPPSDQCSEVTGAYQLSAVSKIKGPARESGAFFRVRLRKERGFEKLVCSEALTAAVLPRVYLLNNMKGYVKGNPNIKRDLSTAPNDDEAA